MREIADQTAALAPRVQLDVDRRSRLPLFHCLQGAEPRWKRRNVGEAREQPVFNAAVDATALDGDNLPATTVAVPIALGRARLRK